MTSHSKQMNKDRAELPDRIELARKEKRRGMRGMNDSDIILVYLPWERYSHFATWEENQTEDLATYHGHYFEDLGEAWEDFKTR